LDFVLNDSPFFIGFCFHGTSPGYKSPRAEIQ